MNLELQKIKVLPPQEGAIGWACNMYLREVNVHKGLARTTKGTLPHARWK